MTPAPNERSSNGETYMTSDSFTKEELIQMFAEEHGLDPNNVDLDIIDEN